MNIGVFCSASDVAEHYTNTAVELATLIARHKHTLVWGGSDTGTMKVIADAAQAAGGKIVGISMELLKNVARKNADEMIIARDLTERKAKLLERSDAIIVLPGGLGTLDEISEFLELKKHRLHEKPIVFMNTNAFYAGLRAQLLHMEKEGFLTRPVSELATFVETPREAIEHVESYGH